MIVIAEKAIEVCTQWNACALMSSYIRNASLMFRFIIFDFQACTSMYLNSIKRLGMHVGTIFGEVVPRRVYEPEYHAGQVDRCQTDNQPTYIFPALGFCFGSFAPLFFNLLIVFMFDVASRSLFALRSRLGCLRLVFVFVVASFFLC